MNLMLLNSFCKCHCSRRYGTTCTFAPLSADQVRGRTAFRQKFLFAISAQVPVAISAVKIQL